MRTLCLGGGLQWPMADYQYHRVRQIDDSLCPLQAQHVDRGQPYAAGGGGMMRAAVNRISDWFDGGDDAYDSLLRFLAFIGLIFGAVILLIALFVVGYMLLGGPQQESLFCANGHELVS